MLLRKNVDAMMKKKCIVQKKEFLFIYILLSSCVYVNTYILNTLYMLLKTNVDALI